MLNEIRQDRAGDARFYKCPSTVKAGDLVLIGALPGVAVDDYSIKSLGTTFRIAGTFALTVIAATVVSPITGSTVNQGDVIYGTGTYDSLTNCTTDLTLSKATGGTSVGTYDDPTPITSGSTSTSAAVKLKESA
jgi:predicted RecA/RadA family phage recombinase